MRVVNRRQDRSILRLNKWLRKSYRCAIEANIRRTRWSDLSGEGVSRGEPRVVPESFERSLKAVDFDIRRDGPIARFPGRVSRRSLFWDLGLPSDKPHAGGMRNMPPRLLSPWPPISDKK